VGEDLDEPQKRFVPIFKNPSGALAASEFHVPSNEIEDELYILRFQQRFEVHRFQVASISSKVCVLVEDVCDPTAHASREVAATGTEHDDQAVGHIFAAVIAYSLHDGGCSGVANSKTLARNTVEEHFSAGRTIEGNVTDDDVLFGSKS
jgi:hypothetical protein